MERIRAKLAQDQALFHPVTKVSGTKTDPIVFEDSDEENNERQVAPSTKDLQFVRAPLQTDRVNEQSSRVSSNAQSREHTTSAPPPVAIRPKVADGDIKPFKRESAQDTSNGYADDEPEEETLNLKNIQENPYERRLTAEETQKGLMDLVQSSQGVEEDAETDMTLAVVEGFDKKFRLMPHQVHGRTWMTEREKGKKTGGILGDDMGLGKTCQTICRIVDYKMEDSEKHEDEMQKWTKTTLVVCPQAVLGQWEAEINKIAPRLKVAIHHGPSRTKNAENFARYDVLLTTYDLVRVEHGNILKETEGATKDDDGDHDSDGLTAAAKKVLAKKKGKPAKKHTALLDAKFLRVVLDEAHNIKNRTNVTTKACWALNSRYRWCLTGTPIQNKVDELFPLIHFLKIRPLNDWDTYNSQIVKPINNGRSTVPMKRLQVVLSSIMLRRKKTDVVNGEPIVKLPARNVSLVECTFDDEEQSFYKALEGRMGEALERIHDSQPGRYMSVLLLLLRLRQACCHPELCTRRSKEDLEAIDVRVKDAEKPEEEQVEDELATMMDNLALKARKCELCQAVLPSSSMTEYCAKCSQAVVPKARRKSTALLDDKGDPKPNGLPSSAKIRKLLDLLDKIEQKSAGVEKTIVFSQFTSFLALIEKFLRRDGIKFVRYNGDMKREEREEALEKFRTSKTRNVALVSFKAGSTGLNLTCANHVILMDLWWNPALEDQAFDRAHRVGQKKDVFIHKLVIPATVEQRIQNLQEQKRELAANALTGHKLGKNSKLGMDELLALFNTQHAHES